MDGIVSRLLDLNEGRLLVPVVLCFSVVLLIKAFVAIGHTRGNARREFLELFQEGGASDELWLSVAIRHQFGAYLPVSLIKRLLAFDQPARALMEVASAWELIEVDDGTGSVIWRKKRHRSPIWRRWIARAHLLGYFVSAMAAALLAYGLLAGDSGSPVSVSWWAWVVIGAVFALWSLHRHELLRDGSRSIKRWLGLS